MKRIGHECQSEGFLGLKSMLAAGWIERRDRKERRHEEDSAWDWER